MQFVIIQNHEHFEKEQTNDKKLHSKQKLKSFSIEYFMYVHIKFMYFEIRNVLMFQRF